MGDKNYLLTYKLFFDGRNSRDEFQWFHTKEEMNEFISDNSKDIDIYEKLHIIQAEHIED